MHPYTEAIRDGLLTADEVDLAFSDHNATTFPETEEQDAVEDDMLLARGFAANTPRSIPDALANLAKRRKNHTPIPGVGMCLYHIRYNCWGINSLWGTAELAGLHGAPIHRYKTWDDAPRGMSLIFVNSRVWHITVSLGGGLNDTSDLHQLGYNGVATIERTYDWCNATDWYGIETVNNVDCWPTPAKQRTPTEPTPWSLERRLKFLRAEAKRQKAENHPKRAAQISHWADTLAATIEKKQG
jgi:hypothetical protein